MPRQLEQRCFWYAGGARGVGVGRESWDAPIWISTRPPRDPGPASACRRLGPCYPATLPGSGKLRVSEVRDFVQLVRASDS